MERRILFYDDYFPAFINSLSEDAKRKVFYSIDMLKMQHWVAARFVKYIRDGLYELRAEYQGNIYRVFSQKTPEREIKKQSELKMNTMQEKMNVRSLDDMMDKMFGKVGSEQRNAFK